MKVVLLAVWLIYVGSQGLFVKSMYVVETLEILALCHSGLGIHSFLENTTCAPKGEIRSLR